MISAILLAAGSSQRMGEVNKLLLPFEGEPLIQRVARNLVNAHPGEVIVVTGHESSLVKDALRGMPLIFVHNPAYASGMTGSIQEGIESATGDGFMICLGDMIMIDQSEYRTFARASEEHLARNPHCICLPEHNMKRGNPVFFSAYYRTHILQHTDPEGCKGIVQAHSEHLVTIPMQTPHFLQDIDYPRDYDNLLKS